MPDNNMEPISIWKPLLKNGEIVFTRPPVLPLGDHYADKIEIVAEKPKDSIRVCYFGESAAAGYLYAPNITPAKILQHQTDSHTGNGKFEIIDLSRTNEQLGTMVETIEASVQLEPDIFVVFTGNNWTLLETTHLSPYAGEYADRKLFAKQISENGFLGPVEYAAKKVLTKGAIAFERIRTIAEKNDIPVILVVPEVNLGDWENIQPVTWLPDGKTARWHLHFEQAHHQLIQKDWESLRLTAMQMLELDEWSCPSSYRLLGKAHSELGNVREAAGIFRAEIDAADYSTMGFLVAPQAGPRTQAFLRKTAKNFGFDLVDLPELFEMQSGSPIPGRRFFMDYCHLTLEGMHLAMAGVTEKLINHSGNGNKKWTEISREVPIPDIEDSVKALAKFGAAIHNTHRLLTIADKKELLEYWCEAALKDDPEIKHAMIDLLRIRLSQTPATLDKHQRQNFESPYRLLSQHGLQYDYLDADLIEVIQKLTGTLIDADNLPSRVRTHPAYLLWEPLHQFFPSLMEAPGSKAGAYLKSPWPETSFCLFHHGYGDVQITVVFRLPKNTKLHSGKVEFYFNRSFIKSNEISDKWTTARVEVKKDQLQPGLNKLTIKWPRLKADGNKSLEIIQQRLSAGLQVDLHPVFGEVFEIKDSRQEVIERG